jgi:DNA repair protein RecO (recombination protein O)
MGKITGAIATDNFLNLKSNFSALNQVFYVLKLFQKMITEQEQDEKTFLLFSEYLKAMDAIDIETGRENILTLGFLLKFLEILGYKLEVEKCAICQDKLKPDNNFFSMERGGAVCSGCAKTESRRIKIGDGSIKLARIFLKNKISNFNKIKADKKDVNNLRVASEEAVRWITG